MIKKTLYPKTKRISNSEINIFITEKLDGSNIGFFNVDDELIIATRKSIVKYSETEEVKSLKYKGLYSWLEENGEELKDKLFEGSGFFGEWIGMGKLKYKDFGSRVYMFAKANIDKDYNVYNIFYNPELFIYPFKDKNIPAFIKTVPIVRTLKIYPSVSELDNIYSDYVAKVKQNVEGFIIIFENVIRKYVRMKNGKLEEHRDS